MSNLQNLGPVSTWQIKNFPDGLRRAIVTRADEEKVTVGELLTRIIVAVMAADWQVGQAGQAGQAAVNPSDTRSTEADLARIERAIGAAVSLAAAPEVPAAFRRRVNRLLRESLPAAKLRVGGGRQKLLAAPDPRSPANGGDDGA